LCDDQLGPLARRLQKAVQFAQAYDVLSRDPRARQMWREVYPELSAGKAGLLGAATSRAEAQVMRLAMLYALLDESDEICAEHLLAGLAVWQYAEQSARYIFGSAPGDPVADETLQALRQRHPDGLSRTDIRDLFSRHQKSKRMNEALGMLADNGLARREKLQSGTGRPREMWFAFM
jgi:hypothetical protein